jgi:large subunit ribosomal protein L22
VANVFNMQEGSKLEPADLYIKDIHVDEGPTMKRFRPRAMGRATMVRKRMSHITVVVGEKSAKR